MNKKLPNLAVVGITAEGRRIHRNNREFYVVTSKMKTNNPDLPEISVPTVFNADDIEGKSPEDIARLITNLIENTQNSLGDLIEMYRGDGLYADMYDERGNRLG
jgi:hypothetical protein